MVRERAPRYIERSREEVTDLFLNMGFEEVDLPGTHEVVFERKVVYQKSWTHENKVTAISNLVDTGLTVRVYTSVARNGTRKCGADAGRVILVDRESGKGVWSSARCYRTKNFLENMRSRCRDAWKAVATIPECPSCKSPMVVRKRKGEKEPTFWGCCKYPECKGTRRMK